MSIQALELGVMEGAVLRGLRQASGRRYLHYFSDIDGVAGPVVFNTDARAIRP